MGPIIQIIVTYLVLLLITNTNIRDLIINYNVSLLIFNLLPIYPLDGGRIINLLFNKRISYLKSYNTSIIISFILILVLVIISIKYKLLINFISILVLLLFIILREKKNKSYYFNKFKLERLIHNYHFKKIKRINKDKDMMRDKKHLFKRTNHYITEKEYLKELYNKNHTI